MTKLEAGQMWGNGKTTRTIRAISDGGGWAFTTVYFRVGKSIIQHRQEIYVFEAWISNTNATLQEPQ